MCVCVCACVRACLHLCVCVYVCTPHVGCCVQPESKVKPGNSDTNFNLLPPINGIQHPLPIQHDPGNYCNKRQLLIAQDQDGCPIKILLMGQFWQWHSTVCVCTSPPPQHTQMKTGRIVFGNLHHVCNIIYYAKVYWDHSSSSFMKAECWLYLANWNHFMPCMFSSFLKSSWPCMIIFNAQNIWQPTYPKI